MVRVPPIASARWRKSTRPLPVMLSGKPFPLSTTSMHSSSDDIDGDGELWWRSACRTALLIASLTTASACSASVASTTDSDPLYWTVVVKSSDSSPISSSRRQRSPVTIGGLFDVGRRSPCESLGPLHAGHLPPRSRRCCISAESARGIVPCSASPTAKTRWIAWSCSSPAMRSRSANTSASGAGVG